MYAKEKRMSRAILIGSIGAISLLQAVPALAKGNWLGDQTAMIIQSEGCPAQIIKEQFIDPSHRSGTGNFFVSPEPERDVIANVSVRFRNVGEEPVMAIAFLWIAFDAFEKEKGRREMTFTFPKGIKPGIAKWTNVHIPLFASAPDHYTVAVSRVGLEGGGSWQAQTEASTNPPAPSR